MVGRLGGFVVIALLIGCGTDDDETDRTLVTSLSPHAGFETVAGSATVTWEVGAGQFVATASITGDTPGAARPWHVHFGTCGSGGDIVGEGYQPLVVGSDGAAQSTATIDFELDTAAPYHVNVHESAAALTTIVACGDLAASGGGGGDDDGSGNDDGPY